MGIPTRKKNPTLALVVLAALVIAFALLSSRPRSAARSNHASSKLVDGKFGEAEREQSERGGKAAGVVWFMAQRTYGLGYIPKDAEIRAVEYVRQRMIPALAAKGFGPKGYSLKKSAAGQLNWEYHGPGNIGGRLRGLVVHPNDPNILYAGSVSGGVWKSTNGGASWFPTMNDLITLNISALEMKPGDPNTLYAGTGEGFFLTNHLPGHGMLKTTDGGNTWKRVHIAEGLNSPFITAIAVSPADPAVVYAAGRQAVPQLANQFPPLPLETIPDRGISAIFKSTDSGETWRAVTSGQIEHFPASVLDNLAADVVVSPIDANVVYATFGLYYPGGIWKSSNGGQTWSRLNNGLPDPNLRNTTYGRIKLAMAPSDPNILYASFTYRRKQGDTVNLVDGGMLGIWKTVDGGQSWTQMTTPLTINQYNRNDGYTTALGSQGNYANAIIVHPTDPNIVFVGGLDIYKTTDGGNSWSQVSMWIPPDDPRNPEGTPYVHADHHVFTFDRSANPPTLYNGSDGGVARSRDLGTTWSILNKDLGVTQFYTFAVHPTNANVMLGGSQDTGTPMLLSGQHNLWRIVTAGDGWQTFFDYTDPTIFYSASQQLNMFRCVIDYATGRRTESKLIGYTDGSNGITQRDAQKADFFPPYELSPNNPNVLVLGTNRLLRSTDRGDSWTPISAEFNLPLSVVAISEGNDDVIWFATYEGKILKTENNGASWAQVTSPILPNRFLTDIEFDPSNPANVYLAFSGYGAPHVFKSTDAGTSWTNITNNLPDVPANAIQVHPQQPNLLFLGTDIGVFLSDDAGQTWQPCTNGLPTTQVTAIVLNTNANRVYAATHGRGAYSAVLGSETATLNIDVPEISLQLQPGYTRSTSFTISNSGNANLNYRITATGLSAATELATGAIVLTPVSHFKSANQRKLPKFDLARTRSMLEKSPLERGVGNVAQAHVTLNSTTARKNTPLKEGIAGSSAVQLSSDADAAADVLLLDDGDNRADTFVGSGRDSANDFYWANAFSLPGFGFRLESFDFYMRTEFVASDTLYFAINDTNGQILAQGDLYLPPSPTEGGWYRIPLVNPLTFNTDSSFVIILGAPRAIGWPAGADVDAGVPNNSFYFEPAQNKFVNLNIVAGLANGAFIIRANGTKAGAASRLDVSPSEGTIAPGGSQTVTVTFDARGLAEGDYQGQLGLASNGGNRTIPVRILVSNTVEVDEEIAELPRAFRLEQNYPNPFWSEATSRLAGNPETSIRYDLPNDGNVTLAVFDLNGRRVALLESGPKTAGQHLVHWNGRDSNGNHVPSGVYFYRLETASPAGAATVLTKKMTVIK